jgi:thioredoxin 1
MESFTDIINSDKPTLVDFFANWCGPCKAMTPVMDQLKKEVGESARILKIDVDKNQSLAAKFQVRGVPTFVIFKSGKVVWRQSGGMSMQTFINELKKHI